MSVRTLRIAHVTDVHVQPELGAGEGFAACLEHIRNLADPADFVLTGGDQVMDSLEQDKQRTKSQWKVFHGVLDAARTLPVEHVVGNHDVWGWGSPGGSAEVGDVGKAWACDELGLACRYRSFDRGGWHFVILDSTHPTPWPGYTAKLDEEQFEWLAGDLAATPETTPVLVASHIPILSASVFYDGDNEASGDWRVPGAWMHIDSRRIKDLFRGHTNVKACVSGHLHLVDQVVYNGVTYLCNGAACAAWWRGDFHECTYGYALLDLYDDGSFENRYVPYGWQTRA